MQAHPDYTPTCDRTDLPTVADDVQYQLTSEDEDEIQLLAQMDDVDFRDAVARYLLADATPADHAIFHDPRLLRRTLTAVDEAIANNEAALKTLLARPPETRDWNQHRRITKFMTRASAARKTLRREVGLLIDKERQAAAQDSPRQKAYRELAKRYPKEFAQILREMRGETK